MPASAFSYVIPAPIIVRRLHRSLRLEKVKFCVRVLPIIAGLGISVERRGKPGTIRANAEVSFW